MFARSFKNIADVVEYLAGIVVERDKSLALFDQHRADNQLAKFMHWNGIEFMGECFTASLAQGFLDRIKEVTEEGMSAEDRFENVETIVDRFVSNMRIRVGHRSTSLGSNLEEDFTNKFYIEFQQRFHGGY